MKNIYKKLYSADKQLKLQDNIRIKIMVDIINKLDFKQKNILDVGCYDGTFLSLIKNRNNKFYGIEASDYGAAQSRIRGITTEQFFIDGNAKLPFKNDFFDVIVAGEIIEHIYDTDFFLQEIHRLLKNKGLLLISTPNIASLGRRLMLLLGLNPIIEISPNEPESSGHIRYFTFKMFEILLNKHGFKVLLKSSDVVNFSSGGSLKSKIIAKFFPKLGQSLIFLCLRKTK
ncbi:MAG: class I SAM-dependent methyltransferase [bacterium]|nr:class I SAM-dependent methyltransferase [bacterium]